MTEPASTNPFSKGDVVYIACVDANDHVVVNARTVKSTFGETDINLTEPTSAHRSRVSVVDAGRTPDLALGAFLDRTDAAIRGLKAQVERLVTHRAEAVAALPHRVLAPRDAK